MGAYFSSARPERSVYGFDGAETRRAARRQLGASSFILACFGIGCVLAFAV